jgi:hypothetical protein
MLRDAPAANQASTDEGMGIAWHAKLLGTGMCAIMVGAGGAERVSGPASTSMKSIDVERIAQSVCKEFGLRCAIDATPDPNDPNIWRVQVRRDGTPEVFSISVFCGPGASPVSIRESLKRQLELE